MRAATRLVLPLVGLALLARPAHANPFDFFGMGARAQGLAGAMTGGATGAVAAHYNPAGVAFADRPEVLVGYSFHHFMLDLDGKDAHLLDAHGTTLGLAVPIRHDGVTAAFGLGLYLPDAFLARIQLIPASEPHFVILDNDPHRIVVEPVFSLRPTSWLSIGAGVNLLADAAGGVVFNVGVVGGEQIGESSVDIRMPTRVTPVGGIMVRPMKGLSIGASARGPVDLRLGLDIVANVDAAAVSGDALISVRSVSYYTPAKVALGASYDVTPDLTASAELGWQAWSHMRGGLPDVRVLVELGMTPPLVQAFFPPDNFRDTVSARGGVEWRHDLAGGCKTLHVRGGYAYEPSPVPAQVGLPSLADNDRHLFSLGAGLETGGGRFLEGPVRFDAALQLVHLRERVTLKDQKLFPGRAFSSGGDIAGLALSAEVKF